MTERARLDMTSPDETRLRAAYQRAVDARHEPGRVACPAPDALLALVRREGSETTRLTTLDHAMSCAECRGELDLLRAIERAGSEGTRREVQRFRWRRVVPLALAASVLLAIALGPGRDRLQRRLAGDVSRAGGSDEVVALLPTDAGAVPAGTPITFVWHGVAGARRYTVEVRTADGSVAFDAQTTDTSVTLAPPRALDAGDYRWWVSAYGEDGVATRSLARRLTVRAP